ncbi:hypothetical protein V8G54_025274 [Vigna mungo]|uniref:Ubiquitin-like protease family profile domain-containing protein n=1 Tax=Vigna mungo TaxID=3915 RepID=A0AAQ3N972_VIGMU
MDFNKAKDDRNPRCRSWCETKVIVEINSKLREVDRIRIGQTPFKWCVNMDKAIDLCSPLLYEMVSRWIGRNKCFTVKQRMVPFKVSDVCMGLGLGVGGLDVHFDDNVVGVVCEQFSSNSFSPKDVVDRIKFLLQNDDSDVDCAVSNMPFKVLDDIDSLNQYDWAKAVHTYLINSLSKEAMILRQRDIKNSIAISGNIAVLQLWAVERLGLIDGEHEIVFPRILKWPLICWQWLLRMEDHDNPVIRATLNLDEGPVPEHGADGNGLSWEELTQKAQHNQSILVEMNKELTDLGHVVVAVRNRRQQHSDFGRAAQGEPDVGARADVGGETEADVQGVEDVQDVHDVEDVEDFEDVNDVGAPPLVVLPAVHPHQDVPLLQINPKHLYNLVTPFRAPWWVVSEICGQVFGTRECYFLGPQKQVDNMGMLFATSVFMFFEKRSTGVVKRICLSPLYAITQVLQDSKKRKLNRQVWTLNDYANFFQANIIGFDDIIKVDLLFAPIIHDGHWWCYAVKIPTMEMFAMDSVGHNRKERKRIDTVMAQNLEIFFGHLFNRYEENKLSLVVQHVHTPIQPNSYDCGVYVLKFMELWDGVQRYDGKTMPNYSSEELQEIRENYVSQLILDPDNVRRNQVLQFLQLIY